MQALHNVFVFLILSYSSVYIRVQALPRHARNTLTTSCVWKQDNYATMTYLARVAIVTAKDG